MPGAFGIVKITPNYHINCIDKAKLILYNIVVICLIFYRMYIFRSIW